MKNLYVNARWDIADGRMVGVGRVKPESMGRIGHQGHYGEHRTGRFITGSLIVMSVIVALTQTWPG